MRDAPVIANNTPLVGLWVLNRLELLHELFDTVVIPDAVRAEFLATETASRQTALETAPWIVTESLADARHALVYVGLDQGESQVIALAVEQMARLVLMDERKGRRYAQRLGIPTTGTVGVLLLAKEKKLIVSIKPLLAQLQDAGLYLGPALVQQALKLAGEVD